MEMVRKECSPKTTIRNIKKILKENKLKVKESKVKNIYKKFYSIRLELKGFYNFAFIDFFALFNIRQNSVFVIIIRVIF